MKAHFGRKNLLVMKAQKEVSTIFFVERLPKRVYVFEDDVRINNAGNFSNRI